MGAVTVLVFSVLATYGAIAAIALGAVEVGAVLKLTATVINGVANVTLSATPTPTEYNAPGTGTNAQHGSGRPITVPIVQATPVTPGSAFGNGGGAGPSGGNT